MPRPTKCRRVCHYPETLLFAPPEGAEREAVVLNVDEFEVIRLIDKEGLSQEEASRQVGVARTTVQRIYEAARRKIASALVEGAPLKIEGGDYRLCSGAEESCPRKDCGKRKIQQKYEKQKGEAIMRIAVTYQNGEIFQHFGHTEQFKLYDVEDGKIVATEVVDTNGSGHGALAGVLQALKADVLICGGIGGGAQMALAEANIKLYGGVSGDADAAVNAFVAGELSFDPDVHCDHHDHEHGECHQCGDHGCGGHGHGGHGHGHCGH